MITVQKKRRIGAVNVRVVNVPELSGAYAQWSSTRNSIELGPLAGSPDSTMYTTTFLHEIIHAISDLFDLGISESQTRGLEQGLTSVFIDNKEFAELYFSSVLNFNKKE